MKIMQTGMYGFMQNGQINRTVNLSNGTSNVSFGTKIDPSLTEHLSENAIDFYKGIEESALSTLRAFKADGRTDRELSFNQFFMKLTSDQIKSLHAKLEGLSQYICGCDWPSTIVLGDTTSWKLRNEMREFLTSSTPKTLDDHEASIIKKYQSVIRMAEDIKLKRGQASKTSANFKEALAMLGDQ